MKKIVIGIDVSKNKLNFCLIVDQKILQEIVIENKLNPVKKFLVNLSGEYNLCAESLLLCAEYTGHYTYPLCCACAELNIHLWLENPMQIKYSCGFGRGKNDKIDARKIAFYALRFQQDARFYSLPDAALHSLSLLLSERDLYLSDRGKYQGQLTDQKDFINPADYKDKQKRLKRIIKEINLSLKEIDTKILFIIESDPELSNQHRLLCSVDGIGERIAVKMMVETNGFRDFKDARKFCCHAGVASFAYTSGSSIRSQNRVSHRADKSIKTLLHMAALVVATRMKGELNEYYLNKVAQGKNKMSVINAVRGKLIHRMFAVIKRNQTYQKIYQYSIA